VRVTVEAIAMSWIAALALALAIAMFVYLVVALFYPEKFL
jgi:K+-transporting ATPase KdpF subunit